MDFVTVFAAVVVFMSIVFIISRLVGRMDIIDIAWGGVFVVGAAVSLLLGPAQLGWNLQTLVTLLVIVWAGRLAIHIGKRVLVHDEDPRYVELRKNWRGNEALNAYFRIFIVQAVLGFIISVPVLLINTSEQQPVQMLALFGASLWLVGFLFESIGDYQLKQYLADPANTGKLMTSGLWRYTRHPNYFGEMLQWWAIALMALNVPFGFIGLIGPLLLSYLLFFVSGVRLSEKRFEGRPGWKQYKARTSVLIPLPPK